MPAEEKTITDLEIELATLAQAVHDDSILLSQTLEAINEADEELETRTAQMLGNILNLRSPEGGKFVYTNDDRRRIKLIEMQQLDQDFQAIESARRTLLETSAAQKASIEKNRNLHKSRLLVLQFYANLP